MAGPSPRVLGAAAGGLETSCLALGLAGAAVDHLHHEAAVRSDLRPIADRFESARQGLRRRLYALADETVSPADASDLRIQANTLALQATQAALTASKGAGFVRPHPAQRWARQALFFLVWSCPRPAAEGTMAYLLPDADEENPTCASDGPLRRAGFPVGSCSVENLSRRYVFRPSRVRGSDKQSEDFDGANPFQIHPYYQPRAPARRLDRTPRWRWGW